MADTSYIKKVVEPYLREWTSEQIGVPLRKEKIVVGYNTENQPVSFEFDGVSEDKKIGVCISASSSYKIGQMRKYFVDATLLNRVQSFKRRIMVFINNNSWKGFKNQCDGMIDLKNIESLICTELPEEMRKEIHKIYQKSAAEVGDKSGPGLKLPGRRK